MGLYIIKTIGIQALFDILNLGFLTARRTSVLSDEQKIGATAATPSLK
jgi:hypothetical protein